MTGIELRKLVKNSGMAIKDIVEKSAIPEQTIYSLYKKKEVEDHYLEKLSAAGLKIYKTTNDPAQGPSAKLLAEALKTVGELMAMLNQERTEANKKQEQLMKDHELYRFIIQQAAKEGNLKFTKKMVV